ncbi:hypothetical protein H009_17928 [Agrobacterium tumefaciens str. Cherry 2E-2-2]|uniref:Uncharacterized protein n=2 Tax=Agrobacterium TaxID=357 RepID=A0A1S7R6P5_9HYPH|nr:MULTISPECIES: hypothetical protein [Agrobacterium]EMS96366.1 hypothetical protein H009_17928 [Agrobacterium tumefaciens str. Cherry 2E-2-2]AYM82175.1 hypothetical protein At12D1_22880 [Agrobacterium tumefaciens]NTE90316.1 hypothetical protein [Agrobacterium tumefaciens]CUX18128.1 conserved hypothetical protein [Agrobacterium tumefaciens str. Kerr 14]CUX47878.1 conserved hypothetical protein [Agrobacterium deltaense Zutra 3/1]
MADIEQGTDTGFTFYTYSFGDDLEQCARQFYESAGEARRDLLAFRTALIEEEGRQQPLRDTKIIRLRTLPVTRKALVELFNGMDGDLGGFIRSREVIEVVTDPQLLSKPAQGISC